MVATCGSGITACVLAFGAERIGGLMPVYDGSWTEWGSDPSTPRRKTLETMTDDDLPIKPATRLVQAGRRAEWTKGVVNVPVWRGSTVLYDNVAHMRSVGAGDLHESCSTAARACPPNGRWPMR